MVVVGEDFTDGMGIEVSFYCYRGVITLKTIDGGIVYKLKFWKIRVTRVIQ